MTSSADRVVRGTRNQSRRGVTSWCAGDDGAQLSFDELPIAVGFGSPVELYPRRLRAVPALPVDTGTPASREPGCVIELPRLGHLVDAHAVAGSRATGAELAGAWLEPVPLRLTARGRAVLLGVAVMIGLAVVVAAWFGAGSSTPPAGSARPAQVVVHDGDTLWSIAGRIAPNRDPRAIVDQLLRINRLDTPALVPGQVLRTH